MLLTSSMSYILNWTGIILLGIYVNEWEIGVYNVARKISLLTTIGLFAVNSICICYKFSELFHNNDMKNFQLIIRQTSKIMFWISLPSFMSFIFFTDFFFGFIWR